MRNILLHLTYDGKDFSGFQVQKGKSSVQGALQEALSELTGEKVRVISSGRTDAGVHAVSQVVNFSTSSRLGQETFFRALNARLPSAIRVREAREVPSAFHARKQAVRKIYSYVIYNAPVLPPFYNGYAWHLRGPYLDASSMEEAAGQFVGEHDFSAFMGSGSQVKSTVRRIESVTVKRFGKCVVITFSGNGFLKNMVRNMVGTMVDIFRNKLLDSSVEDILRTKDRKRAGRCAPGGGLYLLGVDYREFSFRGNLPFNVDFQQHID